MLRLTSLVLAFAVASAAPAAMAFTDCPSKHNGACSHAGGACGTKHDPGVCQTITRHSWPASYVCACHPKHPPH